jgi:hypothetical protein
MSDIYLLKYEQQNRIEKEKSILNEKKENDYLNLKNEIKKLQEESIKMIKTLASLEQRLSYFAKQRDKQYL